MKKTAIEIYALLVCFSSIICLSIYTSIAIYDVVSLTNPSLTVSNYQYINHQNNNNFWKYQSGHSAIIPINNRMPYPNKTSEPAKQRPIEDKLTQQRLESYQSVLDAEKRKSVHDLILELIIISINSVLFFIHWRFILHKNNNAKRCD